MRLCLRVCVFSIPLSLAPLVVSPSFALLLLLPLWPGTPGPTAHVVIANIHVYRSTLCCFISVVFRRVNSTSVRVRRASCVVSRVVCPRVVR